MDKEMAAALSTLTTGLYVLTTGTLEEPYGMIVSWSTLAGYDPPLTLVCIKNVRYLHDLIPRFGCFGLNVLPAGAEELISGFKKAAIRERFKGIKLMVDTTGTPLMADALAYLDCRLETSYQPGDHTIFLGRIVTGRRLRPGLPLTSMDYSHTYLGRY